MKPFAPMLAERQSVHTWARKLSLPMYASFKLDGIRCPILDSKAVTRKLLPIPNPYIRGLLSRHQFSELDGEIIVGDPCAENAFNFTQSHVMSKRENAVDFTYYVFDWFAEPGINYGMRQEHLKNVVAMLQPLANELGFKLELVQSHLFTSWEDIEGYETTALSRGHEGLILRNPLSPYKFGRSTAREQGMLKLKRFVDDEAEIIGFEELMRNENELMRDELGHAKRSSAAEGLVGGDTLGAFIVRDLVTGVVSKVGMFKGLTSDDKKHIWDNREQYLGKIIKRSYFPVGVKEAPRHAKFIGFRDPSDM